MRKKINIQFALIAAVAILLTVALSLLVYYDIYQEEVLSSLRTCAYVLRDAGYADAGRITRGEGEAPAAGSADAGQQDSDGAGTGLRITLVEPDGTVSFDSDADADRMDNHGQRPEVQAALESGEGEMVRRSDTLDKNAFYYAIKLEDGSVLRVGKEAGSVWSFLMAMGSPLAAVGAALLLICLVLAHFLTRSILTPIEQMAEHMDDEQYRAPYREMAPFLDTIRQQHRDIVRNSLMRQEFTANVSHELKTPLTAISGYAELIESGIASRDDTVRFSAEIRKSSSRLLTLINDILRLSELDSMEDDFVAEQVELYELAQKCADTMQMSAKKHRVTLTLSGEPCIVLSNREMVAEIMCNLCSNAIRYNVPDGRVMMSVAREGAHAVFTVEDTGIGIPEKEQQRIFERFYRVDKSRSQSTGGTGLGLAIVKHAAARLGAEIGLWSREGEGTRIRILFPD